MKKELLLIIIGLFCFSTLQKSAYSLLKPPTVDRISGGSITMGTTSLPTIVVDGMLDDWAGIQPIVNDTGDRTYSYDITECKVLVEQNQLYYVFPKKPGGSAIWQLYFDTDLSNQTGYSINGMGADYLLSTWPRGLQKWADNGWIDTNLTFQYQEGVTKSSDGSIEFVWGSYNDMQWLESVEWLEGRINLGVFDNPSIFGLVFQVLSGQDIAPETGYIVVSQNQNLSFAASYTFKTATLHYGQLANMVFNLLNFGPSNISHVDLKISLSQQLEFMSGQTTWEGTIPEGGRLTVDVEAEPLTYGQAISYSNFTWVNPSLSENQTASIQCTTEIVPNVSLSLQTPANMTQGIKSSVNITVTNLDPLKVSLTIKQGNYQFVLEPFSLVLSPNSTIQLPTVPVVPTSSGANYLVISALYNQINVGDARSRVMVDAPRIYMTSINVPSKMQQGQVYFISPVIENEENVPYAVSFSIDPGPNLVCVNGQSVNITLPAKSNTTVTLLIKAEQTQYPYSYATVNLNGAYGQIMYPRYFNIYLEAAPINMLIVVVAIIIAVLILAGVLTLKRKAISEKLRKKV